MAKEESYPKKYWWVVIVAVPITIALIAAAPALLKSSGGSGGGPGTTINTGEKSTVNIDNSTHNTFVTNVAVIAQQYEAQTGRPLNDDLRRQIEQAVSAALKNDHGESIRLFEQIAASVPVPAVYNNLGIEYKQAQNVAASEKAFEKAKMAEAKAAAVKNPPLTAADLRPPAVSGPGIRPESSSVPAMVIEPLSPPYVAPGEIHVVEHGTASGGGSYKVKYQPTPDTPVVMDAGSYDIVLRSADNRGAGFIVASNVQIKEGSLTRVNPNAFVGGIAVEPVVQKGFPTIKGLQVIDRASGDRRLLAQSTDKLGVTLPLAPGSYDIVCTTTDDQTVMVAENVQIKAGSITRIDTGNQLAVILVRTPKIRTELKAVYALQANSNRIASKVDAFDKPLLVTAGQSYDVALEQAAGLTRIKKAVVPKPGELVDIQ